MKNLKQNQKPGTTIDPVCGMTVATDAYAVTFQKIHFAFCSEQCRQRFQQTPFLYIGKPGHQSAKQRGIELIKNRRLTLQQQPSAAEAAAIIEAIKTMMGIHNVRIEGDNLLIDYDLIQAAEIQIENEVQKLGIQLGQDWVDRMRRELIHLLEENQCSALSGSSGTAKGCH